MSTILRDVTHSFRIFRKSPGFTITALAALALGIGATTAIFSVVNAILLKPMPVPDPDRFMVMTTTVVSGGSSTTNSASSPAKFAYWHAQSSVVQDVSAYVPGVMNYTGGEVPEQLRSMQMSSEAFRCWGTPILRGRPFTAQDDTPGAPHVALIGEDFWQRHFAGDPQTLSKTISLNGEVYTVIGIAAPTPAWIEFGAPTEVYVPFQLDPNSNDQTAYFNVTARLRPSVSVEQANASLQASSAAYRAKFPNALGPKDEFGVMPFREFVVGGTRPELLVLLGAVSLVLLIACANVANLLLVRSAGRRREIAIRAAIGAGRTRMIQQLLTESVLLSLTGGGLGLLLGYAGIRALLAVNTAGLPRLGDDGVAVGMDWRIMVFALLLSLATGIVFGLFPALQGSRADLNVVLKDSSGRSGTGLKQNKARAALVVSEVGLAVILLVGSALLTRTFAALYAVDPGFDTSHVMTMRTQIAGPKFVTSAGTADTLRNGLERVRAVPGVMFASATCCVPLQTTIGFPFNILGRQTAQGSYTGSGGWASIAPGYFEVFRIPVKQGRTFNDRDDNNAPAVVVINESMAKHFWKDDDPLKDRIVIGKGRIRELDGEPARQIIGIVGDVRDGALNRDPRPMMYVPQSQLTDALNGLVNRILPVAWVMRTQAEPHALVPAIREQLRQATGLPVSDIRSMDEVVSLSTARQRFNMLVMTVFGTAALLLAGIGIYGLMAYSVEQRTQEIGIRLALGAEASQVRRMIVRQGLGLALAGVVVGLGAAWGLSRLIESLLFGVKARDPLVFLVVPAVLSVVALLAVWLPANRASHVSPVESLRYE